MRLADNFGDLTTADNILNEECVSRNSHRYGVIVQDLATQWLQAYPCSKKDFTGSNGRCATVPRIQSHAEFYLHR